MGEKNRLYPHLMPEEIIVWERFLDTYNPTWDPIQYDVKVGTPVVTAPDLDQNLKDMSDTLTTKRIDVVAWAAGKPIVIEIKKIVGMKALGQAITYPILLAELLTSAELPDVLVIGETATPDMERIFQLVGINLVLV
jgi:hypothetical protein